MMGNYGQAYTGTVPFGRGGMMHGWGYSQSVTGTVPFGRGAMMAPDGVHEQVMTAVAKELGLTYDELQTALQTKTLAQIAEDEGVELEKLQQVAQDAWKAAIEKLVTEGKLTREQADRMLQRMDAAGFPMFGQGRGLGPCFDDDDGNWGPQGQNSAPQEFGFRGGRGGRPGMMGRSTW
jgi:antitoxin component of RelBE/YafQ-DinJ toxin-antitoxin module